MFPKAISQIFLLEIERKFCGLAVTDLTLHARNPPFQSIQQQSQRIFKDTYFDRAGLLTAAAKVRKGGNFQNSRFEELSNPCEISVQVRTITGRVCSEREFFSLNPIATMCTTRRTWLADDRFTIVLDTIDFGHEVGEVELQSEMRLAHTGQELDNHKQRAIQQIDEDIVAFMEHYRWAFAAGVPIGKLTAYFERKAAGRL
ncbi:hypothetical protein yc1106_09483 [Curvularia clavata]|uniref:Thiamine-triphosphatase n=1 Tax=Curvularia clavata TaxID=95742 RepID=A0A9Q9DXR5_CURCL|nr:hypothetical protein yc1106_09483 [Curvularia clavata]